jgi:hypothetical protein
VDLSGSGYGPVAGWYEHVYEHLGFVKSRKFVDYLSDCWLLKEDSASFS